jgi:inhibitor of KinA sporulation pathway (predicted exonuclease)
MNRLLSLDLELNQPSGKTIQVGACVFRLSDFHILDTFSVYVNPQEQLSEDIVKLTGISQQNVDQEGYSVLEAYQKLKRFAHKNKVMKNPLVWGSGNWNDSYHLYREANPQSKNFMGHRVWDVKTLYQMYRALNGMPVKGGLEAALEELGIPKQGRSHDALWDAVNTVAVFKKLSLLLRASGPIKGLKSD